MLAAEDDTLALAFGVRVCVCERERVCESMTKRLVHFVVGITSGLIIFFVSFIF
jgi:hypothetical protein